MESRRLWDQMDGKVELSAWCVSMSFHGLGHASTNHGSVPRSFGYFSTTKTLSKRAFKSEQVCAHSQVLLLPPLFLWSTPPMWRPQQPYVILLVTHPWNFVLHVNVVVRIIFLLYPGSSRWLYFQKQLHPHHASSVVLWTKGLARMGHANAVVSRWVFFYPTGC